jgi:hypothetical protein
MSNSAVASNETNGGIMFASIIACNSRANKKHVELGNEVIMDKSSCPNCSHKCNRMNNQDSPCLLLSDGTHRKGNLIQKSPYLDLILVPCSDVGDGPASLLLYAFLVIMGEKCQQTWKSLIINDKLVHQNAKCYNNGNTEEERDRYNVILEN